MPEPKFPRAPMPRRRLFAGIRGRLLAGGGGLLVLLAVVLGLGVASLARIEADVAGIPAERVPEIRRLVGLQRQTARLDEAVQDLRQAHTTAAADSASGRAFAAADAIGAEDTLASDLTELRSLRTASIEAQGAMAVLVTRVLTLRDGSALAGMPRLDLGTAGVILGRANAVAATVRVLPTPPPPTDPVQGAETEGRRALTADLDAAADLLILGAMAEDAGALATIDERLDPALADLAVGRGAAAADVVSLIDALAELASPTDGILAARAAELGRVTETSAVSERIRTLTGEMSAALERQVLAALDAVEAATAGAGAGASRGVAILVGIGVVSILVGIGIAVAFERGVVQPMVRLTFIAARLARGELRAITGLKPRRDEIGALERSFTTFRENALRVEALTAENAATQAAAEAERQAMFAHLRAEFGRVVDGAVAGNFTDRITRRFDDETMSHLADGINTLVGSVGSGLTSVRATMRAMSKADLTRPMEGAFAGSFAELREDVNGTLARLADLIRSIRGASADTHEAALRIEAGALDLLRRTEHQAATLEQTAATMQQMSASVGSNAAIVRESSLRASGANASADQVAEAMAHVVAAVRKIEKNSEHINDIVKLIDGITFQTNLLSLNAAVEAARAGEAGKGFAVVASEVRTLAQRSASASNDIRALLASSRTDVQDGVARVTAASGALEAVRMMIQELAASSSRISVATQEQTAGIGDVNTAVSELTSVTHDNAGLSERTLEAAEAVVRQAQHQDRLLGAFVLAEPKPRAARGIRTGAA